MMDEKELALIVGTNVRAARLAAEMTQEELAAKCRMYKTHISRLEAGKHLPNLKTLNKVANALRVKVDDLMKPPRKGKK